MRLWDRLLARLGLAITRDDVVTTPPRTLDAVVRGFSSAIDDGRAAVAESIALEGRISERARERRDDGERERDLALAAELKSARVRLESSVESARMRFELFRSEKLVLGARMVHAESMTRAGDSLAGLTLEAAELTRRSHEARERMRAAALG